MMTNKTIKSLLLSSLALLFSTSASSSIVLQQDLTWYANSSGTNVGHSINTIGFQVNSPSEVTIDLLSVGAFASPIDSYIRVAHDDGNLSVDDFFTLNDDGPLGDDGSIFTADSYLSDSFAAGSYLLFVSGCCFSAQEAIDGYHLISGNDAFEDLSENGLFGTYQVTLSGDVSMSPVPIPGALGLFSAAIALLGLGHKRKK